jgi:hypothetical protein
MSVVSYDSEDGLKVGGLSTSKIGFFGTTPVVRPAVTFNATITATFAAGTLGFGFSSSAEAASVIGAIKDIQHVLTTLGLWE